MNLIQNTILTSLPAGRKKTPSGWISFNAPCCVYNGESADKKKRGGIMTSADGTVSYHCFNCGFKASYVIGRKLTFKMRQFMGYVGIPDDTIRKLAIEAMREEEGDVKYEIKNEIGNIYFGKGWDRMHMVRVDSPYEGKRITLGFDIICQPDVPDDQFSIIPLL